MTWKNETGKAIYADSDGNIVEEGDERAAIQVVSANGTLTEKEARRYKLDAPKAESKSVKAAPADKSVKAKEDK